MLPKTALYKQAVTTADGAPNNKRKPLAQGLLTEAFPKIATEEDKADTEDSVISFDNSRGAHHRKELEKRIKSYKEHHSDEGILLDDPTSSPRRNKPQLSFQDSPYAVPSHSLDVSDPESELLDDSKASDSSHKPKSVMVVDASLNLNHGGTAHAVELDISTAYMDSPAKVVCHSPGPLYGDMSRKTGDVHLGAQVRSDRLPQVYISNNDEPECNRHIHSKEVLSSKDRSSSFSSHNPIIIQHPEEQQYPQKPRAVQSLFAEKEDENLKSSSSNNIELISSPLPEASLEQSNSSADSKLSDKAEVSKDASELSTKTKEVAKSETMPELRSTKKKKAPRFVPSRYMSTYSAKSSTTKDKNSSTRQNKSTGAVTSNANSQKPPAPVSTKKVPRKVAPAQSSQVSHRQQRQKQKTVQPATTTSLSKMKQKVERERHFSTPDAKTFNSKNAKSSTPTCENADASALLGPDLSAIGPPRTNIQSSVLGSPTFEHSDLHDHTARSKVMCTNSSSQLGLSSTKKKRSAHTSSTYTSLSQPEPPVTQADLDMAYARYLQMVFLESKGKMAFKQQEKHVMHQLHSLWLENEKLRQKKEDLLSKLNQMKHINQLDECLDVQESLLRTMSEHLPQFQKDYDTLYQAVDSTLHKIPVKGIVMPKNQQQYQKDMLQALHESEQLLDEITKIIQPHLACTEKCDSSLQSMASCVETEINESHRCTELLAAFRTLVTEECSLRVQLITCLENNG